MTTQGNSSGNNSSSKVRDGHLRNRLFLAATQGCLTGITPAEIAPANRKQLMAWARQLEARSHEPAVSALLQAGRAECVSTHPEEPPERFCEDLLDVLAERHARTVGGPIKLACTVVTAADAAYFVAAQLLIASLSVGHVGRFVLCDLGLTAQQRAWCDAWKIERLVIDLATLPMPRPTPGWQTHNKPVLIERAVGLTGPALWLDADTIVMGPLDWVDEVVVRHRPFVVHCFAATNFLGYKRGMRSLGNRRQLYEHFPVPRRMRIDRPNAGVVGLDTRRDRELLTAWRFMVEQFVADEEIARWVSWFDQGCLQWALEKCGLVNCVTHEQRFNDAASVGGSMSPSEFVAAIENCPPQTRVLHFPAGRKPYSKLPCSPREPLPFVLTEAPVADQGCDV